MNNRITDKTVFKVFVVLSPFILFLNVLSFQTKNAIGGIGTNLFFVLLAFLFVLCLQRPKFYDRGLKILILLIVFVVVKNVLYQAGGAKISTILLSARNYIVFALYYYFGMVYLKTEMDRRNVLKFISIITIISVIIGSLHYNFFYNVPFIDLSYATSDSGAILYLKDTAIMRFRESSVYFGPNVYAYMLVFGYICYYFRTSNVAYSSKANKVIEIVSITLLVMYGLVQTDSRSALFLLFVFISVNVLKGRRGIFVKLVVPIFIIAAAASLLLYSERFSLGLALSDPRFAKLFEAYLLLSQSAINWIIGLPAGSAWEIDGLPFSDNLFGAIMLEGGFVLFFICAYFVRTNMKSLNELGWTASSFDKNYLSAVKFSLVFFLFYGLFSIPTGMASLFNYLGLLLGGATRIGMIHANNSERAIR